jgi:hypothetical protein
MRQYKDLAVKDPRMGVFSLNGLRSNCKMDCYALASDFLVDKGHDRRSAGRRRPGPSTVLLTTWDACSPLS